MSTLPTIVIVGRPNVGKSTLFNRIVGRRIAVVEDTPGITRDRLYAETSWNGKDFTVVDTGGILFSEDDPLIEQIRVQAEIALAEADVVFFVVDCADGPHPDDMELANRLRGFRQPIYILANKADNKKRIDLVTEFFELGLGDVHAVSALNGYGVADVLDLAAESLAAVEKPEDEREEVRLAIVGRPNVGKSSLLNAFTGQKRVIVSNIPGTTRDAVDTLIEYRGNPVRLIDTAGLRRRGKIQGSVEYYMALRANKALERADCGLVVIDGTEGFTDGDKRVAKSSHDLGRALVLVVNKWDQKEPPDGETGRMSLLKKDFVRIIRNEMPEVAYAPVVFTSATESAGLERALDTVLSALEAWSFRISTGQLNRLIQDATFNRPYVSKGRQFKVYYSTQVSARPPSFVLFCNDPELMHFSYKRYLENQIREQFPLVGTPIRVMARARKQED